MAEGLDGDKELRRIRTCFVIRPDGDLISVFAIDGRRYTDPRQARQAYDEAWEEMSRRRVGCEWETWFATPSEPLSRLPSWEEYRVNLDEKHPMPSGGE